MNSKLTFGSVDLLLLLSPSLSPVTLTSTEVRVERSVRWATEMDRSSAGIEEIKWKSKGVKTKEIKTKSMVCKQSNVNLSFFVVLIAQVRSPVVSMLTYMEEDNPDYGSP